MVSDISSSRIVPAATVADAVAGDAMAFARIVQAHHDDMTRVCSVICGDPELAQDAAQSAWPIVWQKLASLAPGFGAVLLGAGRTVVGPDGEVEAQSGPFRFLADDLCAALGTPNG